MKKVIYFQLEALGQCILPPQHILPVSPYGQTDK